METPGRPSEEDGENLEVEAPGRLCRRSRRNLHGSIDDTVKQSVYNPPFFRLLLVDRGRLVPISGYSCLNLVIVLPVLNVLPCGPTEQIRQEHFVRQRARNRCEFFTHSRCCPLVRTASSQERSSIAAPIRFLVVLTSQLVDLLAHLVHVFHLLEQSILQIDCHLVLRCWSFPLLCRSKGGRTLEKRRRLPPVAFLFGEQIKRLRVPLVLQARQLPLERVHQRAHLRMGTALDERVQQLLVLEDVQIALADTAGSRHRAPARGFHRKELLHHRQPVGRNQILHQIVLAGVVAMDHQLGRPATDQLLQQDRLLVEGVVLPCRGHCDGRHDQAFRRRRYNYQTLRNLTFAVFSVAELLEVK
uniref:Uncharacterized protein n=1 Tax=Anopheles atroparvus TaxID=41427 RepID=A0A182JEZ7_ANOAO